MRADDETEFIPLDRWEEEYTSFQKLIKVLICFIYDGTLC